MEKDEILEIACVVTTGNLELVAEVSALCVSLVVGQQLTIRIYLLPF